MRLFYFFLLLFAAFFISSCSSGPGTRSVNITAVPSEAGSVTPAEGEFEANRTLEIAAYPNEHWAFDRWEGDHEGTKNPAIINLDSDKDIAAIFVKKDYSLTVTIEGQGTVSERVVQQKTTEYPYGTVVEITADAEAGWEFSEWQGDLESTENPATITIDGEMQVTAVFTQITYPLTVNIVGEGSVSEAIVQAKATDYPQGTVVSLTAEPDTNWVFSNWTGDIESTENPAEITIDEPKTVTATFLRTFTLTTVSVPENGGTINPAAGQFVRDTSFNVEAIPNEGWRFVEWRGDFTGTTNPFNLTMNGNKTLEAHFEALSFGLTTNVEGSGEILTNVLSGGETADGYEFNSEVELTAVPASGWRFVRWEGDASGTGNPTVVIINGSKSVTAVFSFFDGGNGTAGSPYQISRLDQLQAMQDYPDSHFILMDDIDASSTSSGDGFDPVGDQATPFTGSFDGNGFIISDLSINRSTEQYVGLFGYTADGSTLQNIRLEDVNITGGTEVGALAGSNNGDILNSYTTGTVNGSDDVGGLAGRNNGTIGESFSSANTTGTNDNVGGLAGNNSSTIINAYALGSVTGNENVGGLIGTNAGSGSVSLSYAAGMVTGAVSPGGVVGLNSGTVSSSYWDTEATMQASSSGSGDTSGMTGLTTAEMTGDDADDPGNMDAFDFTDTWSTAIDYPVLQWVNE